MDKFLAINKKYFNYKLKSIDLLIIAQIEEFQRNECECYVTNEQLSEMFGESESTIKRAIDKLENMNIINRKTTFIRGNGRGNKQRVLSINDCKQWKVQNEPTKKDECKVQKKEMEGSNDDNGRFKKQECKVQNEPIKDNLKENKKITLKDKTKKRKIGDLENWEGDEICQKLKRNEKYITLADEYNLERGVITKDFPKQWQEIRNSRAYWAEQEAEAERRKNEPYVDWNRIYAAADKNRKKEEQIDISDMLDDIWY